MTPNRRPPRGHRRMTRSAVCAEPDLRVGETSRDRLFVLDPMASIAGDRGTHETLALRPEMTCIAIHRGVHSDQGEAAGGMLSVDLSAILPSGGRVAGLTGGTELTPVHVGVAVDAGASHVAEHQVLMAVTTFDGDMTADEGKPDTSVLEVRRSRAYRPVRRSVASFTVKSKGSMWIAGNRLGATQGERRDHAKQNPDGHPDPALHRGLPSGSSVAGNVVSASLS